MFVRHPLFVILYDILNLAYLRFSSTFLFLWVICVYLIFDNDSKLVCTAIDVNVRTHL